MEPADNLKLALETVGLNASLLEKWQKISTPPVLTEAEESSLDAAKALILTASNLVRSLPASYQKIAWMLEDTLTLLENPTADEYDAEEQVLGK